MNRITTHVLDTAKGGPAPKIRIVLYRPAMDRWEEIAAGWTNEDGRIIDWFPSIAKLGEGVYKMKFETKAYFDARSIPTFYPFVEISFEMATDGHYHIPLLISPFGYSTYRGS